MDPQAEAIREANQAIRQAEQDYAAAHAAVQWYNDTDPYSYVPELRDTNGNLIRPAQESGTKGNTPQSRAQDEARLRSAEATLAKAHDDYANILAKFATQRTAQAKAETDPAKKALWEADAAKANAAAAYAQTQAATLKAKTPAEVEKAQKDADLAAARAVQVGVMTPELAAEAQAKSRMYGAHAGLYDAQATRAKAAAGLDTARADILVPAQAQALADKGELTQAQADYIKQSGPAKIDDLVAKGVLNAAKAEQIRQKLTAPQIVDAGTLPNIVQRNPATGEISSTPNPNAQMVDPALFDFFGTLREKMGSGLIPLETAKALAQQAYQAYTARTSAETASNNIGKIYGDYAESVNQHTVSAGTSAYVNAQRNGDRSVPAPGPLMQSQLPYDPQKVAHDAAAQALARISPAAQAHVAQNGPTAGTQFTAPPAAASGSDSGHTITINIGSGAASSPQTPQDIQAHGGELALPGFRAPQAVGPDGPAPRGPVM